MNRPQPRVISLEEWKRQQPQLLTPVERPWTYWVSMAAIGVGGGLTIIAMLLGLAMGVMALEMMLRNLPRW